MSTNKAATKADLQELYSRILPYLGGSADAGFTPVGTVISVMGNHAPANYLKCDGATYNIVDYPELADYFLAEFGQKNKFGGDGTTTFAVPDLQGEFLRGSGTNSHTNQGSGATVGTHQDATEHVDVYDYGNKWLGVSSKVNSSGYGAQATKADTKMGREGYIQNGTAYSFVTNSAVNAGSYTSRPTNTSVLYCIATKNIYMNPSLDYSTSEKVVGTFIDGKPIYQKTYVLDTQLSLPYFDGTPSATAAQWISTGISSSGIDLIISATTMAENGVLNPTFQTNKASSGSTIGLNSIYPRGFGVKYLTLRYTKTTD